MMGKPKIRLGLVAVAFAGAVLGSAAWAQTGKPAPTPAPQPQAAPSTMASIAVIDIQAVLRQASAAQALQKQFKEEQDAFQATLEKQQKELKTAEEELERQRASLAPEAFADRRRKFQERVGLINAALRDQRRVLDEAFNAAMAELQTSLNTVIEDLAKRRGINMVLRKEAVLANLAAFDLTAATLEEFNRRFPVLKATFPPRP